MSKYRDRRRKPFSSGRTRAKLSFDDGFAERPFYAIKAFTTEKHKGMDMLDLIIQNFGISEKEMKEAFRIKMEEFNYDAMQPTIAPKGFKQEEIKFTRDEKGNIISPFKTKIDFSKLCTKTRC